MQCRRQISYGKAAAIERQQRQYEEYEEFEPVRPRVTEGYSEEVSEPLKLYELEKDGTIRVWDPERREYRLKEGR